MSSEIFIGVAIAAISMIGGYFFSRWNKPHVTPALCEKMQKSCALLRDTERTHAFEKFKHDLMQELHERRKVEDEKFVEFKKETRQNFGMIKGMLISLHATKEISVEELRRLMETTEG